MKTVSADQLMYVKEDLILPHHYTFYDFIVTKVIKFLLVYFFHLNKKNDVVIPFKVIGAV